MFEITRDDGIAVLAMRHKKANAMDLEFCEGLAAHVRELSAGDALAIVLIGQGRIFSAGVDLMRIVSGGPEYAARFMPALSEMFNAVFESPKPVVAAINGAAIAGGCVLACAADQRVLAAGAPMGIPELRVGVPFPSSAMEIMRFAASRQHLQSLLYGGATFADAEALARGLADEIVPADAVAGRALALARALTELPPAAYAQTKRQLRDASFRHIREEGPGYDREATALWADVATHERIRAYIEKTFKPAR